MNRSRTTRTTPRCRIILQLILEQAIESLQPAPMRDETQELLGAGRQAQGANIEPVAARGLLRRETQTPISHSCKC